VQQFVTWNAAGTFVCTAKAMTIYIPGLSPEQEAEAFKSTEERNFSNPPKEGDRVYYVSNRCGRIYRRFAAVLGVRQLILLRCNQMQPITHNEIAP
jgi:hypothetical protein